VVKSFGKLIAVYQEKILCLWLFSLIPWRRDFLDDVRCVMPDLVVLLIYFMFMLLYLQDITALPQPVTLKGP
jgi:hypothetical protein